MESHSVSSNSNNVVALQRKDSPIQQEPGKTHQEQPERLLSVLYGVVGPLSKRVTIGSLPDNVLLDIFESHHIDIDTGGPKFQWQWETLVHVCQRWRYLIFGSPIRLNLQLFFSEISPVMELLDVWPPFPFIINFTYDFAWEEENPDGNLDNLFAALEHRDRVREIRITSPMDYLWEEIITEMEEPFPELRSLILDSVSAKIPLPATFLNGSAPCLQELTFCSISFPSLPRLLSSTSDLTSLHLIDIPDSGYIRPKTMARSLSALPKLTTLSIDFDPSAPHFDRLRSQQSDRPVPSRTRSVLPALTYLELSGVTEYLEALLTRIDAPLLNGFKIQFVQQPDYVDFLDPEPELAIDIPQTVQFFGLLEWFRPSTLTLKFDPQSANFLRFSSSTTSNSASPHSLAGSWHIKCRNLDRQVIALTQMCSQISPCLSSVQSLIIELDGFRWRLWPRLGDMDPTIWLPLFHLFPSVQSLQIPDKLVPFIAVALQGLRAESAAEVFPSLHSLSVVGKKSDDDAHQGIQSFIIARQQSNHPVALSLLVTTPESQGRRSHRR
jgi:hypothetical protein